MMHKAQEIKRGKQAKRPFQHAVASATTGVNFDYKGLRSAQSSIGETFSSVLD